MLNKQQIETFKNDGILILENFFSEEEVVAWRKQALAYHDNPVTDDDWRAAIRKVNSNAFKLIDEPTPYTHPKMQALYESLAASIIWDGENELVARAPEMHREWLGARTPHLDFPVYDSIRTLVNSVFYLADVNPYGGPFMYWPGSHLDSWEYFKESPKDYMSQGDLSQDQIFERITHRASREVQSFSGKAGDLMLWHSLILHSASVNKSNSARLAVIGRWGNMLKNGETRFDFNKSIWDEWKFNGQDLPVLQ